MVLLVSICNGILSQKTRYRLADVNRKAYFGFGVNEDVVQLPSRRALDRFNCTTVSTKEVCIAHQSPPIRVEDRVDHHCCS